jgi:hypothetical protein
MAKLYSGIPIAEGKILGVLQHRTDGWHDIRGGKIVWKWNGKNYDIGNEKQENN